VVHKLPSMTHCYPDVTIRLIPFICKIEKGHIRLNEHENYAWIPMNKLIFYDWSEADKNLILLNNDLTKYFNGPVV
jgi:8-oxo-dGTP diphosphatase